MVVSLAIAAATRVVAEDPSHAGALGLFERLQKADEIVDLARVEPKLRHPRMSARQSLTQGVRQRFDRILPMKHPKWRCGRTSASGSPVDRMTLRTVGLREGLAAPNALCVGESRNARENA